MVTHCQAVIQCLVFELCDEVYKLYHAFLEKHVPMNKEGCIQLIFDMKFIFDILAGRRDVEAVQNIREISSLIETSSLITYETKQTDEFEQIMEWNNKVNKLILQVQNQVRLL